MDAAPVRRQHRRAAVREAGLNGGARLGWHPLSASATSRPARLFDNWASSSPVSLRDLSIYRIVYATLGLLQLYRADTIVAGFPAAGFLPPPGPFRLLTAPPPLWVLAILAAVTAVALAMLLVGWFTTAASIATGVLQISMFGVEYSYNQIDHTILLAVVPLALAWSGWGDRYSVDARRMLTHAAWGPRLLAVCIGVAFFTAGVPKVMAGWLDPSTQATRGQVVANYFLDEGAAAQGLVMPITWWLPWEALDWFVVAIELLLLVGALAGWGPFRVLLCLAALLHLGIQLTIDISFDWNVIAYGAFVPWWRVFGLSRDDPGIDAHNRERRPIHRVAVAAFVALVAFAAWGVSQLAPGVVHHHLGEAIVIAGGAAAIAGLISLGLSALRWWRARALANST